MAPRAPLATPISDRIETERTDAPGGRLSMDPHVQAARLAQTVAEEGTEAPAPRRPAERRPFGLIEQQLAYPPIPSFRLYWFNDTPGRVARAKDAGYEHVHDQSGQPVCRNVGKGESGGGVKGYLMKIPLQWYIEDMQAAQGIRDRTLADIKEGRHGANVGQNQYVPRQGIVIDQQRR